MKAPFNSFKELKSFVAAYPFCTFNTILKVHFRSIDDHVTLGVVNGVSLPQPFLSVHFGKPMHALKAKIQLVKDSSDGTADGEHS